jgi:hypothetical protein
LFELNLRKGVILGDLNSGQNSDCKDQMHKSHLCYLIYEGKHDSDPKGYKKLVAKGNFICEYCGRTAKDAESLCSPKEL